MATSVVSLTPPLRLYLSYSIAMSNDENIQCIQQYSQDLKVKKTSLVSASATLRAKLASFNIVEG